jgi:hypothetical protein
MISKRPMIRYLYLNRIRKKYLRIHNTGCKVVTGKLGQEMSLAASDLEVGEWSLQGRCKLINFRSMVNARPLITKQGLIRRLPLLITNLNFYIN